MEEFMAALASVVDYPLPSAILVFLVGALGALIKDVMDDDGLQLPSWSKGTFYCGFLGGILIGGTASLLTGNSLLSALTAGFMGSAIISAALVKKPVDSIPQPLDIPALITSIAKKNKVNVSLALAVAEAESSFNPSATHSNANNSIDRGLYQINNLYHPEVSEAQAFDPKFSAQFFCDAVNKGNLSWWNASKPRWIDKVVVA